MKMDLLQLVQWYSFSINDSHNIDILHFNPICVQSHQLSCCFVRSNWLTEKKTKWKSAKKRTINNFDSNSMYVCKSFTLIQDLNRVLNASKMMQATRFSVKKSRAISGQEPEKKIEADNTTNSIHIVSPIMRGKRALRLNTKPICYSLGMMYKVQIESWLSLFHLSDSYRIFFWLRQQNI